MKNKSYNFQKLTPAYVGDMGVYDAALEYILEDSEIKNIGITGSYGAGKSSVINTFVKNNPKVKFITISLSHFSKFQDPVDGDGDLEIKQNNILEGKIINQLIHQIDQKKIPLTGFKLKKDFSKIKAIWDSVICTLFIVVLIYLINYFTIARVAINNNYVLFKLGENEIIVIISIVIIIFIIIYFVYNLFRIQCSENIFKGLRFQGNSIEVFEQSTESYFDKYLKEVIYLFEKSEADVIVFEDLDRYNINLIFQKLREVNTILNRGVSKRKSIKFFYLIKDDVFISKERTKFFDYILPIVPIIDGSNSYDKLIEFFTAGGVISFFDKKFLQEVSIYIDDMRILKNIYNEFMIYNNKIVTTGQNINKMLSMIIYKNLFPNDFCELQFKKGFVYFVINNIENFKKEEIKKISEINIGLESTLENIRNEISNDEDILELYEFKKANINNKNFYYSSYKNQELTELEAEKNAKIDKFISKDDRIEKINEQISNNNDKITAIKNLKLHKILNKDSIDNLLADKDKKLKDNEIEFCDIKESHYFNCIKYLINNGYIDESFADYMTYFYETTFKSTDQKFLRSITDEVALDYDYKLVDVYETNTRIRMSNFYKEEVLNYDLLNYLLKNRNTDNLEKIDKIYEQIIERKNYKFIESYVKFGSNIGVFIELLNKKWCGAFKYIMFDSTFTNEMKKTIIIHSIYNNSVEKLIEMNIENCITDFISKDRSFLDIDKPKINEILSVLVALNVSFIDIDYERVNSELFTEVYNENLYAINFNMLILMLVKMCGCKENEGLKHKMYTIICQFENSRLYSYVDQNIEKFVECILENCEKEIFDDEKFVLKVLNNDNVSYNYKKHYVNLLSVDIQSLEEVNVELWDDLMSNKLIRQSSNNALHYFYNKSEKMKVFLDGFINECKENLVFDYKDVVNKFGQNKAYEFLKWIAGNSELSNKQYKSIMYTLNQVFNVFEIEGLSGEKMDILLEYKGIAMSKSNLLFMRKNYFNKIGKFIEANIEDYSNSILDVDIFNYSELLNVLEMKVKDKYKINCMVFTIAPISVYNDAYSDHIKIHILNKNLDTEDIKELLEGYEQFDEKIQSCIFDIVLNRFEFIIENGYKVPFQLCKKVYISGNLSVISNLVLFTNNLQYFSKEECEEYLTISNCEDLCNALLGRRPNVLITDINKKILDVFMNNKWISSYAVNNKDHAYYRVIGRRNNLN